jgi:pSer/pThr/pTyr-binding forkhead associated (FHA) protein
VPQRQRLPTHRIVIGREGADLDLSADDYVSTRHAVVTRDAHGRVTVEDLGSTNGTFVNSIRIYGPMRLYPGDMLRIGRKTVPIPAELFTAH